MRRSFSFILLAVMLLGLSVFGVVRILQAVTDANDGWDLFAGTGATTEPLTVQPTTLVSSDDRDTIEHIVEETRTYGIPWSIVVVQEPVGTSVPTAQELAEERWEESPVESAEGADDGLLMLVMIPEDDPAQTATGFVTGNNFYPRGGITPERLDWIVDIQMAPLIADEQIGDAVIEGATWVEWTHLFEPTPDQPASSLERGLQELLEPLGTIGFAGLTLIVVASAGLVVALTRRGSNTAPSVTNLDGVLAAAIARGRIDRPVIVGALLDTVDRGVLKLESGGSVRARRIPPSLPRDAIMISEIDRLDAASDQSASVAILIRSLHRNEALAQELEDGLAEDGAYHPKSPVWTLILRWIAVAGVALGVIAIVASVLGEARYPLGAAVALTTASLIVALWNERRSWATRAGDHALTAWLDQHQHEGDPQRMLYDTVVKMEELSATRDNSGPLPPATWRLLSDAS